jgi:hypothetical protein
VGTNLQLFGGNADVIEQMQRIALQNNENIVLQSQMAANVEMEDANEEFGGVISKADAGNNDPFAPVEMSNFEGLTPDQIRDLMNACPDSYE